MKRRALSQERIIVAYPLTTLEEHGFLTSKYEISEAGGGSQRVRHAVTDRVAEVKAKLKTGLTSFSVYNTREF